MKGFTWVQVGWRTVLFPSFQSVWTVMGRMNVGMYEFLKGVRPEGSVYSLHHFQSKCLAWSEQKMDRIHLVPLVSGPVLRMESNHCTEGETCYSTCGMLWNPLGYPQCATWGSRGDHYIGGILSFAPAWCREGCLWAGGNNTKNGVFKF